MVRYLLPLAQTLFISRRELKSMMHVGDRKAAAGRAMLVVVGVIAALFIVALIFVVWAVGVNNQIVRLNQTADGGWAQVQSQYQRRLDLIPNLVATVQGAAAQELQVVIGAVRERAKATQVQVNPGNAAELQQFAENQGALGSALSRLLVTVERYPEMRTNQNFLELQSQLEGTENRIAVERQKYNDLVKEYNNTVLVFPGALVASFRNFKQRPYFMADIEAQRAPRVDFGAGQAPAVGTPPANMPGSQPTPAANPPQDAQSVPPPPTPIPAPTGLPPEGNARPQRPVRTVAMLTH